MDVWSWVYNTAAELRANGHHRLADIVVAVPGNVEYANRATLVAMVQEGLMLARGLDHAWLEVYLRHWLAQCLILRGHDVSTGLEDLVRLLDFAHQERTRECPQSVCVCQDVCCAYRVVDGPGYAEQRLQASHETLSRIDAAWPCFECLSAEHAAALIDADRLEDAERFCLQQQAALRAVGEEGWRLLPAKLCTIYSLRGEHAKALQVLTSERAERACDDKVFYRLQRAGELARLGRGAEAQQYMVAVAELKPSAYVEWAATAKALCAAGCMNNDHTLGATLRGFVSTLRAHGALHDVASLALLGAELAIARGSSAVAALNLQDAESMLPLLRKPQQMHPKIVSLRSSLPSAAPCSSADAADVVSQLGEDQEQNLQLLLAAIERHPESEAVVSQLYSLYLELGFAELAVIRLRDFIARHPHSLVCVHLLLESLLHSRDAAGLDEFVRQTTDELRPRALFYQARLFKERGEWAQCATVLQRALELRPDAMSIKRALALAYRHLERWLEALVLLNDLVQSVDGDEPNDDHWDRAVAGTAAGDFAAVRDSARRLGFQFEGDGPIDEFFEYCDIVSRDDSGEEVRLRAHRISPVLARIVQIVTERGAPGFMDEVLFDPAPIESSVADAADSQPIYAFKAIQILRRGNYRNYELDGIHPGEEHVAALKQALHKLGAFISVHSSSEYMLTPPGGAEDVLGIYALIAVPAGVSAAALHSELSEHADRWPGSVVYRALLTELGLHEKLAQQESLAEQMGL